MGIIFDMDGTIINSDIAEDARNRKMWDVVKRYIPKFKEYYGMKEVILELISMGEKVGIVSNSPLWYCKSIINQYIGEEHVEKMFFVCGGIEKNGKKYYKPDKEPIIEMINKMNEKTEDIICIGDSESDIVAADKAGILKENNLQALWGKNNIKVETERIMTVDLLREYLINKGKLECRFRNAPIDWIKYIYDYYPTSYYEHNGISKVLVNALKEKKASIDTYSFLWKKFEKCLGQMFDINEVILVVIPSHTYNEWNVKIMELVQYLQECGWCGKYARLIKRKETTKAKHLGGERNRELEIGTLTINEEILVDNYIEEIRNKRFIIIDDIVTTGTSMLACYEVIVNKFGKVDVFGVAFGKTFKYEKVSKKSNWMDLINLDKLTVYPLQYANVERIRKNDICFIFDEVGTGKTISSGMMALTYLDDNPDKEVLVITTPILANGQFYNDWNEKFAVDKNGYKQRITVINNIYSNIRKLKNKKWGLIVLDEAHLFLNDKTEKYMNLKRLKAEKIVFLTATPLKDKEDNFEVYQQVINDLINDEEVLIEGKKQKKSEIFNLAEEKLFCKSSNDLLLCETFDANSMITRYFKDTVRVINERGFSEKKARRLNPEVWYYDNDKDIELANKLKEILGQSQKEISNNIIIFTRYIEEEAKKIGNILQHEGFVLKNEKIKNKYTYYIVTGDNKEELEKISKLTSTTVPDILIMTYQIAEQGVNLPNYNYVVNYHIPSYPSALEQRFGRIDRITSEFEEIHMAFLLPKDDFSLYKFNFNLALKTYMKILLTYVPSKNSILTSEVIQECEESNKKYLDYCDRIGESYKKYKNENYNDRLDHGLINIDHIKNETEERWGEDFREFIDFLNEIKEKSQKEGNAINSKVIEASYTTLRNKIIRQDINEVTRIIEGAGTDKIFYKIKDSEQIGRKDPIECGEKIYESENFKKFMTIFKQNLTIPYMYYKYKDSLNKKICELINSRNNEVYKYIYNNDFTKVVEQVVTKEDFIILQKKEITNEFANNIDILNKIDQLKKYIYSKKLFYIADNSIRIKYSDNPFELIEKEWKNIYGIESKCNFVEKEDKFEATELLKIVYAIMGKKNLRETDSKEYFKKYKSDFEIMCLWKSERKKRINLEFNINKKGLVFSDSFSKEIYHILIKNSE